MSDSCLFTQTSSGARVGIIDVQMIVNKLEIKFIFGCQCAVVVESMSGRKGSVCRHQHLECRREKGEEEEEEK